MNAKELGITTFFSRQDYFEQNHNILRRHAIVFSHKTGMQFINIMQIAKQFY
jgi:hypothetical protein